MAERYIYEKWDTEKERAIYANEFTNDTDGKMTGKIVMNVKAWLDENPEERKRLGWVKHISYDKPSDVGVEYNPQTQNLNVTQRQVDEYTVEDVYYVMEKSEEQLYFEEMLETVNDGRGLILLGGNIYE